LCFEQVAGYLLLVTCFWLLVTGYWLLVTCCWLLVEQPEEIAKIKNQNEK